MSPVNQTPRQSKGKVWKRSTKILIAIIATIGSLGGTLIANLDKFERFYRQSDPGGNPEPSPTLGRGGLTSMPSPTLQQQRASISEAMPIQEVSQKGQEFATLPSWASLGGGIQWKVESVENLDSYTHIVLQIKNTSESLGSFLYFATNPLAIIDEESGDYYPMKSVANQKPRDIQEQYGQWYLQGGRSISITVNFEPLKATCKSGKIGYSSGSSAAQPAKFLLK